MTATKENFNKVGTKTDFQEEAIDLHRKWRGKIEVKLKVSCETIEDLSLAYTPGVAAPCLVIAKNPAEAATLTMRSNSVAVVTDGSAVLGLGNIGPLAALPVMEGKALLFKRYANIDAWPICLDTQDTDEIIRTVRNIAPGFGGINLEDIAAPRCFEIERALQDLGIPVFHDDQDGTAIAVLAGLINGAKVVGRKIDSMKIVICGAGAAGIAIARLLCGTRGGGRYCRDVTLCDSKGVISSARTDLTPVKTELLSWTNQEDIKGSVHDALKGADVFIGVSKADLLTAEDIQSMNADPLVFAMANPNPEIRPCVAYAAGAAVVATGRSDYANQVNNVLVFPGLFRGALDSKARTITPEALEVAALALAGTVSQPRSDRILPNVIDTDCNVAAVVAEAVRQVLT